MKILLLAIISCLTMSSTLARTKCEKRFDKALSYFDEGRKEFSDAGEAYEDAKKELENFWYDKEVICEYLYKSLYAYRRSAKAFDKSYAEFRDTSKKCGGRLSTNAKRNMEVSSDNVKEVYNIMSFIENDLEKFNCSN